MNETDKNRFWKRVTKTKGCWIWDKPTNRGYGQFGLNNKTISAHRASFLVHGISLIPLMPIDHSCRNRLCVNPKHLKFVTPHRNTLENSESLPAQNKRKTHCPKGHPLSGPNLRLYTKKTKDGTGLREHRYCKKCVRINQIKYEKKVKRKR